MMSRLRQRARAHTGSALRTGVKFLLAQTGWIALGKSVAEVPPYYTPIPDPADLPAAFWEQEVSMVGVAINDDAVRNFARTMVVPQLGEFRSLYPVERVDGDPRFFLLNGSYMAVDAQVLHGILRTAKPRRVVEIGSGASTRVIEGALRLNLAEGGAAGTCTSIDPFPSPWLNGVDGSLVRVLTEKVQSTPMSIFDELGHNDVLFIDSSHVVREGNDVLFEYMEILPRLRRGVLVHIHDISLPRRPPKTYFDSQLYWTEQYLLKAYLTNNSHVEIIWPGNYMALRHPAFVAETFPELARMRLVFPSSEPTAFWFRVC